MAKYKLSFSGFVYIEADSEEEAQYMFEHDDYAYFEYECDSIEEVDEFLVCI